MKNILKTLSIFLLFIYSSCLGFNDSCLEETDAIITITTTDYYTLKPVMGCTINIMKEARFGSSSLLTSVSTDEKGMTPASKIKFTSACENPENISIEQKDNFDNYYVHLLPFKMEQRKGTINRTFAVKQRITPISVKIEHKSTETDSLLFNFTLKNLSTLYTRKINSKIVFDSIFTFKTFPDEKLTYEYSFVGKSGIRQVFNNTTELAPLNDTLKLIIVY
jgi:hypothetical protein